MTADRTAIDGSDDVDRPMLYLNIISKYDVDQEELSCFRRCCEALAVCSQGPSVQHHAVANNNSCDLTN